MKHFCLLYQQVMRFAASLTLTDNIEVQVENNRCLQVCKLKYVQISVNIHVAASNNFRWLTSYIMPGKVFGTMLV